MDNLDLLGFARKKKKRNYLKIVYGLLFSGAVSIVLAGQIGLNLGNVIEFGQGVARTSVCDNDINIVPNAELMYFHDYANGEPRWAYTATLKHDLGRPYMLAYLREIGEAVSNDTEWAEFLQTEDEGLLLNKVNYPFFYLTSIEVNQLNIEACEGKELRISASAPNSSMGPISFLINNDFGSILKAEDPIVQIYIDKDYYSFTGRYPTNFTRSEGFFNDARVDSGTDDMAKSISVDFFYKGPKYLTQSINKFKILTLDDTRQNLDTPEVGTLNSHWSGGYFKIKNYDETIDYQSSQINYIGDGVFRYWGFREWAQPHEEPYEVNLLLSKSGFKSILLTQEATNTTINSSSDIEILLSYARTGVIGDSVSTCYLNAPWCLPGVLPRAELFFDVAKVPDFYSVGQVCRTDPNITDNDLINNGDRYFKSNWYFSKDSINYDVINNFCTLELNTQYYYKFGIFKNDTGELLASSEEIVIPPVLDSSPKNSLQELKMFYPN